MTRTRRGRPSPWNRRADSLMDSELGVGGAADRHCERLGRLCLSRAHGQHHEGQDASRHVPASTPDRCLGQDNEASSTAPTRRAAVRVRPDNRPTDLPSASICAVPRPSSSPWCPRRAAGARMKLPGGLLGSRKSSIAPGYGRAYRPSAMASRWATACREYRNEKAIDEFRGNHSVGAVLRRARVALAVLRTGEPTIKRRSGASTSTAPNPGGGMRPAAADDALVGDSADIVDATVIADSAQSDIARPGKDAGPADTPS
jgi:hypothetical protein